MAHGPLDDLLDRAARIVGNPYIPLFPQPKQASFLGLDCLEALYGGAAFGGKTYAILMDALQYADVPGYRAILFRRSYPELARAEGLIPLSREWLWGKGPVWNEQKKQWTFASGATLSFGSIELRKHLERYMRGPSYQFIGFEELTTFPEDFYRGLFSRLRRPSAGPLSLVPLRMRSTTNPGGEGHAWVKARFGLPQGGKDGRAFVPARLGDNRAGDAEAYLASLAELDPITRARMLEGNWDVMEGGTFIDRAWFPEPADRDEVPETLRWVRAWDCAGSTSSRAKYTAGVRMGRDMVTGLYWILGVERFRERPSERDGRILEVAKEDGVPVRVLIEQEPADAGIKQAEDQIRMLAGFDVICEPATKAKLVRATPFSRQVQAGNVRLVEGAYVSAFLDEMQAASETAPYLDQLDAAALAFNHLAAAGTPGAAVGGAPRAATQRARLGQWSAQDVRRPLRRPLGRR